MHDRPGAGLSQQPCVTACGVDGGEDGPPGVQVVKRLPRYYVLSLGDGLKQHVHVAAAHQPQALGAAHWTPKAHPTTGSQADLVLVTRGRADEFERCSLLK